MNRYFWGHRPHLRICSCCFIMSMKQLSFPLSSVKNEHGGSLATGKRRSRRNLSIKQAHHVTLKSNLASGGRCLLKHQSLIKGILYKSAQRFNVRVYQLAIAGNHVHVLVKARSRLGMQNFFRVFAGHTAQQILKVCPLPRDGGGASGVAPGGALTPASSGTCCRKNQRRFWGYLIYSRILTWGREFRIVKSYIIQNSLEVLGLSAYKPRIAQRRFSSA